MKKVIALLFVCALILASCKKTDDRYYDESDYSTEVQE